MTDNWTSTGITNTRLLGLKLHARMNNRSVGRQLETILEISGIPKLTPKQFEEEMRRFKIK